MTIAGAIGCAIASAIVEGFDIEILPFTLALVVVLLPQIILYSVLPQRLRIMREALYWSMSLLLVAALWSYSFRSPEGGDILRMIAGGLLSGAVAANLAARWRLPVSPTRSDP